MDVKDFSYTGIFIPIKGFLKVKMRGVYLNIVIKFQRLFTKNRRILPQLNFTECTFKIDTNKVTFDLGGSLLFNIADLLLPIIKKFFSGPVSMLVTQQLNDLPNKFNKYMVDTNGQVNFGDLAWPDKRNPYNSLTLDVSLDEDFRVFHDRLEFAINGTFYNKDKHYKIPWMPQTIMPMHDPAVPGKL
jgi:hypothetical protein